MLLPAKLQHRHPAFEMPMKLAKTAILGGFPDLEMLRRIDSESADWRRKTDTVIGTATQLATLGLDMGSIELRPQAHRRDDARL